MNRYVCIHGHFYQPPRENPWLEDVELQDTAYPFHDWNMRITEECYKQNAASRILGSDKKIIDIVNNYSDISFNFGPTLLGWLQSHEPGVYESIIEADKASQKKFSGHGSAIAQAYNHMILPLSNDRDKHTQVLWGIHDFQRHFNRKPEGMWLPETAVNTETLEVLAEYEIKFTILAPRQARQIRQIDSDKWQDITEENLDTTMPYLCKLPSGRSISLFFYNGAVAQDVAYGGLLHSGEDFSDRLIASFIDDGNSSQLVHIATDGESFGHHHRYGDMALAYCLYHIKANDLAKVTIYGEYLEKFPPTHEVKIIENSSWSCIHGVERWKNNCGCCGNQSLSGKQQWREPLRNALDMLRDRLAEFYEAEQSTFCTDPWQVRNRYIELIENRSEENVEQFIKRLKVNELSREDKVRFLKLLEMQRMAMLMYTSCGWFFDNLSGIETVQVMLYAARAMQLYQEMTGTDLLDQFKMILQEAPSNVPNLTDGQDIYEKYVEPARIDLFRVGAHFALSSVFEDSVENGQEIYCYTASMEDYKSATAGTHILATGRAHIRSNIVWEKQSVDFATLHMGGHNLFTALTSPMSKKEFSQMRQNLEEAFYKGDSNAVMNLMNVRFSGHNYSIWHLFKDEQRRMVYELLSDTWEEVERTFRHIYEHNYPIMLMLRNMNMNLPKALSAPAEFIVNQDLCAVIEAEEMDITRLKELTDEAARLSLQLDTETLRFEASSKVNDLMEMFEQSPDDIDLLEMIENALRIFRELVPEMDLQLAQNILFTIAKEAYPPMKVKASAKNEDALIWCDLFRKTATHLGLVIE